MKRRRLKFFIACIVFNTCCMVNADDRISSASARTILKRLSEGVTRITLSNGMRAVYFRRSQAPVFSGQVWVKVGGVNEVPGTTGVAHMLEHMAFKGTETIGTKDYQRERELLQQMEEVLDIGAKLGNSPELSSQLKDISDELEKITIPGAFAQMYENRGASGLNAGTAKDYTNYVVSLPNVAFEIWCLMESERLLRPVFREFYKEREVVREERRMRVDDSPSGRLYEAVVATAFMSHPNRLPTIGWASDIESLRVGDIESFHRRFYRPDNIVLSLVGDLDVSEVSAFLEKYFGRIPTVSSAIPKVRTKEESQTGERRVNVNFDAEPMLMLAYHKPVYPNKDDLYFSVFHSLLADGRSSVLYRELVDKRHLATSIDTSEAPGELFPSVFTVHASPSAGVQANVLVNAIQAELDKFAEKGALDADLHAAKKRVRIALLSSMSSNEGLSETLGHAELLWGNWEVLFEMYDTILATSSEDIKRLASKYLIPTNRTVGVLTRNVK